MSDHHLQVPEGPLAFSVKQEKWVPSTEAKRDWPTCDLGWCIQPGTRRVAVKGKVCLDFFPVVVTAGLSQAARLHALTIPPGRDRPAIHHANFSLFLGMNLAYNSQSPLQFSVSCDWIPAKVTSARRCHFQAWSTKCPPHDPPQSLSCLLDQCQYSATIHLRKHRLIPTFTWLELPTPWMDLHE